MFPTARGVVYFMIWRAIWHLARGIIHARAARCVCACMRESSLVFPTRRIARRGIGTCVHACVTPNTRAHAWGIAPRTRVHTHSARDRYALRPSASKPLEVEALRKYNADWRNSYLSPYTRTYGRDVHTRAPRARGETREKWKVENGKKEEAGWNNASEKESARRKRGQEGGGNNFYDVPSNIYNTRLTLPLLFYTSFIALSARTKFMVFHPQLYALVLSTQLDLYAYSLNTSQLISLLYICSVRFSFRILISLQRVPLMQNFVFYSYNSYSHNRPHAYADAGLFFYRLIRR